jgi:hypothetical protein
LPQGTTLQVFLRDHSDKAVMTEGFKGTAIFVIDGKPQRIASTLLVHIPVERVDAPLFAAGTRVVKPDVQTNARSFEGRIFVIILDDLQTAPNRSLTYECPRCHRRVHPGHHTHWFYCHRARHPFRPETRFRKKGNAL